MYFNVEAAHFLFYFMKIETLSVCIRKTRSCIELANQSRYKQTSNLQN